MELTEIEYANDLCLFLFLTPYLIFFPSSLPLPFPFFFSKLLLSSLTHLSSGEWNTFSLPDMGCVLRISLEVLLLQQRGLYFF